MNRQKISGITKDKKKYCDQLIFKWLYFFVAILIAAWWQFPT
jgi:hypothetical protein